MVFGKASLCFQLTVATVPHGRHAMKAQGRGEGKARWPRPDDQDAHRFRHQNVKLTRPPKARPLPS